MHFDVQDIVLKALVGKSFFLSNKIYCTSHCYLQSNTIIYLLLT